MVEFLEVDHHIMAVVVLTMTVCYMEQPQRIFRVFWCCRTKKLVLILLQNEIRPWFYQKNWKCDVLQGNDEIHTINHSHKSNYSGSWLNCQSNIDVRDLIDIRSGRVVIIVKRLLVENPLCLLLLTWKAQMRFSRSLHFFTTQSRASSEHHWILQKPSLLPEDMWSPFKDHQLVSNRSCNLVMIWQVHENTTLVKYSLIWSKLVSRGQSLFSNAKIWLLELLHQQEATYPVE